MAQAEQTEKFSFHRFARQPFYREVNAHLVDLAALKPGWRVVDLACGTGAVTKLIIERLQGIHKSCVIAMDASTEALEGAKKELSQIKSAMVKFVCGQAEQLSQKLKETVDAVIFCNAIHLIEEKERVLKEVFQVLAPGGVFAFNTTFFSGAQPPETAQFYRRWMTRALRLLKRRHGLLPARDQKVTARRQLSAEQYGELLSRQGFELCQQEIASVDVPLEGWLGISEFSDFIEGALPGIPLDKASQVLQEAVTQVFQELELRAVPRLWLQVVAVRP
jgi:ubiquinone/menaquinone biosynthesis C-methylase UbiE